MHFSLILGIPPRLASRVDSSTSMECGNFPTSPGTGAGLNRRSSQVPDVRIPLNAKIIPKQLVGNAKSHLATAANAKVIQFPYYCQTFAEGLWLL